MGTETKIKALRMAAWPTQPVRWSLLGLVVALFILLLYPNLLIQPHRYHLGDIAGRDIKAGEDFFVEDKEATESSRQLTADRVLTVYDYDPGIAQRQVNQVNAAFADMRRVLLQFDADHPRSSAESIEGGESATDRSWRIERENALWAQKSKFEAQTGVELSRGALKLLINESFSPQLAKLTVQILEEILNTGVVANKEILLRELDKGITLRNVASQTEKTVFSLRQYYGPDQAKTMVRVTAEPLVKELNYNVTNLLVDLIQRMLQPNITMNRNETERRRTQALAELKPIMYQVKAGEMILREGERVTAAHVLKLAAMRSQAENKRIAASGVGAAIILTLLLAGVHLLYFRHPRHMRLDTNRNLLFMALAMAMVFLIVKMAVGFSGMLVSNSTFAIPDDAIVYAVPAAVGTMLVCIFIGFEIALPFGLIGGLCSAMLIGQGLDFFIFFLINSAMAAHWVRHCRERKAFIIAGAKLGLLNMVVATVLNIYASDFGATDLLWIWGMAFLGGIGSAIITLGVAPLIEMAFSFTTDITLLELANLDRPILRRLMLEAPGTYHHSMIVGSLVEAAASDIGANPLLAKVCGYYHDIGKLKKPLYFIENQTAGRNKHDKLAPSMSSLILIAHLKDGIEIARKHKLGHAISDTIQQHHGTSLISYFYEKAKQVKGGAGVKIDNFRYPGPKPQTREAALVMLADVVEAASRALDNPTPARIQGLVQHLINKIFSDGQLDECELTLKDLHRIAKSFNKILYGIHHHRIEYADTANKEEIKSKNGSSDRQSADKTARPDEGSPRKGEGHLKRLGLS
jgi:cyclic-di-AMP phosphodiesterase PgpH